MHCFTQDSMIVCLFLYFPVYHFTLEWICCCLSCAGERNVSLWHLCVGDPPGFRLEPEGVNPQRVASVHLWWRSRGLLQVRELDVVQSVPKYRFVSFSFPVYSKPFQEFSQYGMFKWCIPRENGQKCQFYSNLNIAGKISCYQPIVIVFLYIGPTLVYPQLLTIVVGF